MAVALIERQFNFKIKRVMSDKEQSVRDATEDVLREEGFIIDSSVIDNHNQNGTAEALGAAIIAMARSLIVGANLPRDLWPEAVKTAVWLLNRIPCKKRLENGQYRWIIPLQEMAKINSKDSQINLANIKIYGSKTFVKVNHIPKL